MKKITYILLFLPVLLFSQTNTQNWVKTKVYKQPTTTSIAYPSLTEASTQVKYLDGLGRTVQIINIGQSDTGKDIIQHIEYDNLGRQVKEYLPFTDNTISLQFRGGTSNSGLTGAEVIDLYNGMTGYETTDYPYSEKEFEASPLNKVLKQSAPGATWALGNGHEIKLDYTANTTIDAVKLFTFDLTPPNTTRIYNATNLHQDSFYNENQLYKNITVDENSAIDSGKQTEEFKDKQGKVVLKRIKTNTDTFDTYYVYDDYGNLTYVIPPKAADNANISNVLDGLCYQYKYDYRNRLVAKKLPGKHWEYIVYDKLDRVRAVGPTLSPFKDMVEQTGWLYTKYDRFSRPILTAWKQATVNENTRAALEDQINEDSELTYLSESRRRSSSQVLNIPFPFSNRSYPKVNYYILSINYFDDYNFGLVNDNPTPPAQVYGQDVRDSTNGNCKGLATGSWIRILENSTDIDGNLSHTFYKNDRMNSPIFTSIQYLNGGYTNTLSDVDFEGKVLKTETEHLHSSGRDILTTKEKFTYSPQGRLISANHQTNAEPIENMVNNYYKELGELVNKEVGGTQSNPLQTVDYTYNIRGWLTAINDVDTIGDDLFAFKISYDNPDNAIALYNGNISETFWKTNSDNNKRKYKYSYDGLNRLLNATYKNLTTSVIDTYNETLLYDKNGNIQSLQRNGGVESSTFVAAIDNLTYFYDNNSNQLKKVVDLTNSTQGFKDDVQAATVEDDLEDDYNYDTSGNMIKDQNKHITNIKYNHLNLPIEIDFTNNRTIYYTYDASGVKLKKDVFNGTTHIVTDYTNGYQYKDAKLQFFPTAEGYVQAIKWNDGTVRRAYKYVYNYTDHLGNIRISYVKEDGQLKRLDENHYYPFGLKHSKYNQIRRILDVKGIATNPKVKAVPVTKENVKYKYKFNGTEWQDEFDLNLYSMDFRLYAPAIARWTSIDPITHHSMSPYTAFDNNPTYWADPSGADSIYNFDTGQYVINGKVVTQNEAIAYAQNGGNADGSNNNKADDKIINPDKAELEKIAQDFNTIFNRKFGETPFKVVAEERGEGEDKHTVYVLKGSVGFDWEQHMYTRMLRDILMSSEDITVDIMGGTRGENLLKINGGGQTMNSNRVEISNLLIQKKPIKRIDWSFGGVTLHELIRHIHVHGDIDSPSARPMRVYFKIKYADYMYPHPREGRYNKNIRSTAKSSNHSCRIKK